MAKLLRWCRVGQASDRRGRPVRPEGAGTPTPAAGEKTGTETATVRDSGVQTDNRE